jgi:hypothetical protein
MRTLIALLAVIGFITTAPFWILCLVYLALSDGRRR